MGTDFQWPFHDPKMEGLYHNKTIFCGKIPFHILHRPYICIIYGRYLQFRILKWPLRFTHTQRLVTVVAMYSVHISLKVFIFSRIFNPVGRQKQHMQHLAHFSPIVYRYSYITISYDKQMVSLDYFQPSPDFSFISVEPCKRWHDIGQWMQDMMLTAWSRKVPWSNWTRYDVVVLAML